MGISSRLAVLEALPKWCDPNPLHSSDQSVKSQDRFFNSRQEDWKHRPCVYCGSAEHKSVDCNKVVSVAERKKHLSEKRLCFNIALVPDTEQQSVVSREVARSVMVDITRQSVTKNSHSYC